MWICSCLAPKAPGEKAAVCQMSDLRLWANWKHQGSGRINKKGSETLPSGKTKTKHATRANGCLTAWEGKHARFRGMSEDGEVVE